MTDFHQMRKWTLPYSLGWNHCGGLETIKEIITRPLWSVTAKEERWESRAWFSSKRWIRKWNKQWHNVFIRSSWPTKEVCINGVKLWALFSVHPCFPNGKHNWGVLQLCWKIENFSSFPNLKNGKFSIKWTPLNFCPMQQTPTHRQGNNS